MEEHDKTEPTVQVVQSPGEMLRQAREKYGLSEEDVAAELNLSALQVRALEENRFHELPGETYIRGYLKSYARLLDTDEKDILQHFSKQGNAEISGIRPVIKETRSSDRHMKLLTVLVMVVLAGLMFMWWQNREQSFIPLITVDNPEPGQPERPAEASTEASAAKDKDIQAYEIERSEAVPTVHDSAADATVPGIADAETAADQAAGAIGEAPTADDGDHKQTEAQIQSPAAPVQTAAAEAVVAPAPSAAPTNTAREVVEQQEPASDTSTVQAAAQPASSRQRTVGTAAAPGTEVKLQVTATSWVDLRDATGKKLLYQNIDPGRQVSVHGEPPFSVFLGNAEGVEIEYAGKPFDFSAFTNGIYARFELGKE